MTMRTSRRRRTRGLCSSGQLLIALLLAAAGCSTPARLAPSPVASTDSVERITRGLAQVAVAARRGLGIVVLVRGRRSTAPVTLRPDDAALWSARAAL
jgi:hypothetical protein